MNCLDLSVDEFLERVRHMPDIEAEQEIVLRKERGSSEIAMLNTELFKLEERGLSRKHSQEVRDLGRAIQVCSQDNSRVNEALKALRKRIDRLSWSEAVRANFGEEGWAQCREWMEMNRTC